MKAAPELLIQVLYQEESSWFQIQQVMMAPSGGQGTPCLHKTFVFMPTVNYLEQTP